MKSSKSFAKTIALALICSLGLQTTVQAGWFLRVTQSAFSLFSRNPEAKKKQAAQESLFPTMGTLAFQSVLAVPSHIKDDGKFDGSGFVRNIAESTVSGIAFQGVKRMVKDTAVDVFSCSCKPESHGWGCWFLQGALDIGLNSLIHSYIVQPTFSCFLGDKKQPEQAGQRPRAGAPTTIGRRVTPPPRRIHAQPKRTVPLRRGRGA